LTSSTPEQQACFASLPPYKVQRREKDGKVVYAFADKNSGLLYVGGEQEYQRFRELGLQHHLANQQLQVAQMNANAAFMWAWGPPGFGWW
jgi:hypothetical protein